MHLSESCEEDTPQLITNVETSLACTADDALTPTIHASLQKKALLPNDHRVDTGYLDAELLVESKPQYQVNLIGPTRATTKGKLKPGWDLKRPVLRSTGPPKKRVVPRERSAAVGHQLATGNTMR